LGERSESAGVESDASYDALWGGRGIVEDEKGKTRETAMPIYEYHCLVCNRDFEKLVMTSPAAVECTNCGSELLEKKFSLFGSKVAERVGSFGASSGESGGSCGCGSCTCH
jgi:putative FmdB family regulatory protein